MDSNAAEGRQFLLTTTNKRVLEQVAGKAEEFEILGRPFDFEELLTAVKSSFLS